MATNRVPHILYNTCPVVYGSLSINRYFEQPPQATLTVRYIPQHKLASYLATYADKTKVYSFFDSFFVVESYQTNTQRLIEDNPILVHDLVIVYKSYILHKGESLFIPKSASVGEYDRANIHAIAGLANLKVVGDASPIKLSPPEEFDEGITINFLDTTITYSRIKESYIDFNYRNEVKFCKKNEGQNYVVQNSKEYLLEFYETKKATPLMLYNAKTPPLYENYDEFFLSQRYRLPTYVLQPLNRRVICRSNYETAELLRDPRIYMDWQAYLEYLRVMPVKSVVCSTYLGQNLIAEESKTIVYFRLNNRSYSSPTLSITVSAPTEIVVEQSEANYLYLPYDVGPIIQRIPKVKVYDGSTPYFVKITPLDPPVQRQIKVLAKVSTRSFKRERLYQKGHPVDDIFELHMTIADLQARRSQAQAALAATTDGEERKDIQLSIDKIDMEIAKTRALITLANYIHADGTQQSEFIIEPYIVRNQDLLYGQVIRERPQVMGIPALETDREGFAYYLVPDPNWYPPLYVANESIRYLVKSWYYRSPEWFDVYFMKAYEYPYLQAKLNYYTNMYNTLKDDLGTPPSSGFSNQDLLPVRGMREQLEATRRRMSEILAMDYPPLISLEQFSNTTTTRTILEEYETTIDPITREQKRVRVDAYQETVFEESWKSPDRLKIQKTSTTTNYAKPPSPVFWIQPYIPIDYNAATEDKYIYFVSTTNNPLSNWIDFAEKYIDLPQFPTTSWQVYRPALVTFIELANFMRESTYDLKLFGMHHYLLPGDYLRVLDIPELNDSRLRVLGISFTIEFNGLDEDNTPLALCNETVVTLGRYSTKTIEWQRKRLPKAGATYEFDIG